MVVQKVFRCVIMGPAGSGKGTIAGRILEHFDMRHMSCGDFIRSHIGENTDLGREARQYTQKGQLVPDDLVAKIMTEEIKKQHNISWLLDGFPRTKKQAKLLDSLDPPDGVIDLDVPFRVIIERLTHRWIHAPSGRVYNLDFNPPKRAGCDDVTGEPLTQREDDKPEVVQKRLDSYKEWEVPVSEYYSKQKKLHRVSGEESNIIWPGVYKYLADRLTPKQDMKTYK